MVSKYNVWSFYLVLFCLGISFYSLYAYLNNNWFFAPPNYLLFLLSFIMLIVALKGFKQKTSWSSKLRGWLTVVLSFIVSISLILAVLFSLLLSSFGANERISTSYSPDENYKIDFYRWDAGAAGTFGIRGELNGPFWFKKRIYYERRVEQAEISWENNHSVSINNHLLNLTEGETYGY